MKRKTKRENGSGSVVYRKDQKNKPWVAYAPASYVIEGGAVKAKRVRVGSFATAAEAKTALAEFMRMPTARYNMTLQEAYNEWSERHFEKNSDNIKVSYRSAWNKVPERMRRMKMRDLRTADYQSVIDANESMSKGTLNNIKLVLSFCCRYAERNDVITKNYASFVEIPQKEQKEKETFTELELEKIKQAVFTVPYADVVYLLCYTGLRINELLTLTPFAYDKKKATLTGGLKTKAGKNRTVPLADPLAVEIVERWIAKGGETIICQDNGKPFKYTNFRRLRYDQALKGAGVRVLTPHACRHTAITRAAKANLRPEEMMRIFGHANYEIEAVTYIHPDTDTLTNAMKKVK